MAGATSSRRLLGRSCAACIRSDGCVFINRTGPYRYESYGFYNRSTDILDLFARTCDQVDVAYRRNHRAIRINRRTAVAAMLQHVGRKS